MKLSFKKKEKAEKVNTGKKEPVKKEAIEKKESVAKRPAVISGGLVLGLLAMALFSSNVWIYVLCGFSAGVTVVVNLVYRKSGNEDVERPEKTEIDTKVERKGDKGKSVRQVDGEIKNKLKMPNAKPTPKIEEPTPTPASTPEVAVDPVDESAKEVQNDDFSFDDLEGFNWDDIFED